MSIMRAAAVGLLAVLLAGCAGVTPTFGSGSGPPLTTSGTILATEVSAAAELAGKVTDVLVEEGQAVRRGDPVARLDTAALQLQLAQARAGLALAEARLAEAQAGPRPEQVRQAEQMAAQAEAALAGARRHYDTIRRLYDEGAVPKTQLDSATTQLETAEAQARAARAQANLAGEGATPEQIKQLEAGVAQAKVAVDQAELNLDRATVTAPISGVVLRRLMEPGALVSPGAAIVTLADLSDLWLRVYIPEKQLNLVRLGMELPIYVDPYPNRPFRAEVVHISDKAEFTPRNVQTKEERAKTVYAAKLKLREGLDGELKPGMPADVILAPAPESPGR